MVVLGFLLLAYIKACLKLVEILCSLLGLVARLWLIRKSLFRLLMFLEDMLIDCSINLFGMPATLLRAFSLELGGWLAAGSRRCLRE
jgi:hypothetical protein